MTMKDILSPKYNDAVHQIKTAIMQSQSKALASINQEQLALYYGIGRYISYNTRKGAWGKDAIATISKQLSIEMPGLKGFSTTNLKNMRLFYEQWKCFDTYSTVTTDELQKSVNSSVATDEIQKSVNSAVATAELGPKIDAANNNLLDIPIAAFFSIGFTHHIAILSGSSTMEERSFYIGSDEGKTYSQSLLWYHHLREATDEERLDYTVSTLGIHWRNLNEDVSFESFEYDDAEPSPMQRFFLTHKEINVAEFARSMGMNPTLLRNYINGFKKPSKAQEQKIIDHIHKLGAEMLGA